MQALDADELHSQHITLLIGLLRMRIHVPFRQLLVSRLFYAGNPRRACARVTVVVVCLSVYPSVPALAASASV